MVIKKIFLAKFQNAERSLFLRTFKLSDLGQRFCIKGIVDRKKNGEIHFCILRLISEIFAGKKKMLSFSF